MDNIKITIPPKEIYLKSLRLLASSLASDMGFDIEDVEDIRVVVSEAVNYKISDKDIEIEFIIGENQLKVEVFGKDRPIEEKALEMRNLILESLADEVEVTKESIKLVKRVKK